MTELLGDGLNIGYKQALSIAESNYTINVFDGAIRSGKTFASQIRWLGFLADPPKGGQFVMVGRTRDSLARNVLAPMQDPQIFGPYAKYVKYTHGAPLATIFDQRVHIMGASDSKAEKAIRGMTLAGAYGDEITIQSEEFFTQLLGRMNVDGAKGFFTTNPDSPAHWLKEKFLDRIGDPVNPLEDWGRWTFQLDDNPVLSEKYKARIRNEFTGLFYKRFVLGQWVSAEGAVYDMWNPARNVIRNADMPRIIRHMAIGIDYGTTNPTAAILLGLGEDDRLYAIDEWNYTPGSKAVRKTDVELSADVKQWISYRHDDDHPDATDAPVIVDPAAASFRVQLYQDGIPTYAAENDVLYGIRTVSGLLSADRLRINERCTGLIKEIPGYSWDPKATKQGIDAVIKENDHCIRAGEPVTTGRGQVPIEQVTTDDVVLTRAGYKRVLRAWKTADKAEIYTVVTGSGRTVSGTGNHEVWTENRGWIRLDALQKQDILLSCSAEPEPISTQKPKLAADHVVEVYAEPHAAPVYDLTVEDQHEFFAGGLLVHNCLDALRYACVTTENRWRGIVAPNT